MKMQKLHREKEKVIKVMKIDLTFKMIFKMIIKKN